MTHDELETWLLWEHALLRWERMAATFLEILEAL